MSRTKLEILDTLSPLDIVTLMNEEDREVPIAVQKVLPEVARGVSLIENALQSGGRLIYIGAGTSGRLGVLDSSECPPTFGVSRETVQALISGGQESVFYAFEHGEDSPDAGKHDLESIQFSDKDVLVGIAASGSTPYVLGAVDYAHSLHAKVIGVTCRPNSPLCEKVNVAIVPVVGKEIIEGASRLKAGTAQKLVLNMLSTAAMVRLGKVYGRHMVDVKASNDKLIQRQIEMVMAIADTDAKTAEKALLESEREAKTAVVMVVAKCDAEKAHLLLKEGNDSLRTVISRF